MERALSAWLATKPVPDQTLKVALRKTQKSYVVYGTMALLPLDLSTLTTDNKDQTSISPADLEDLYTLIKQHLKVTHLAITKPIPLHNTSLSSTTTTTEALTTENALRSPTSFHPLSGPFGPSTSSNPATTTDFSYAYWVTAKQNSIHQTWSPRWTMFSRGNVSEKARLLNLPSVVSAVEQGRLDGRGCAAVDMYVGIGYFAFSYVKAGIGVVLGWDLNAWSLEGLRRGAGVNGWGCRVISGEDGQEKVEVVVNVAVGDEGCRLVVFHGSNERALGVVKKCRERLPPVRHVNCGLLPSSRASWEDALRILDPEMGGWIHVHENLLVKEIEERVEEMQRDFAEMMRKHDRIDAPPVIEGVNRLKTYAPGVMHCVVDVYIPPLSPAG